MSKIASKLIAIVAALLIAFTFVFTGAILQTVSAATAPSTLVETKVVSRVEYGSEFDVKAGATVMSPAGIEVEPVNGKVKAEQVGVYKVTYKAEGAGEYASYTYNVEVYMDNEYKFIVDGNGSAIPTFCGVDTKVTLPVATLYIYDEEDERWVADTDAVVKVRVSAPDGEVSNKEAGDEITLDEEGKYFFTYVVTVPGGENIYTTEYSTQVQRTFKDDTAPTLSISGVPASSSINTAIKLPNATATDNYDERVGLTITVKKDGVDVKDAKVDKKTGFATGEFWGDAKAKFDNDTFMTFYPTEAGSYEVTYQATDCAGNSTAVYKYTITVSDTTAPVFDEFDVSSIPSNWGKLVYKYDETATDKKEQVTDTNLLFPIPELIDNAGDENLRVSFNLTDPKNKTVVSFDNVYATDAENAGYVEGSEAFGTVGTKYYFFRYWENSAYSVDPATGAITGTGISGTAKSLVYYDATAGKLTKGFFSFDDYKATSKAGSYTATYRARDDEGNASSRTYNVNYKATFEDLTVPTVSLDTPDYFAFRDYETTQSITNVVISDSNDARLDVQYYVVFNQNAGLVDTLDYAASFDAVMANADDAVELPVSGSNVLTFEKEGSDYNVTVNDVNGDEIVTTVDASKPIYVVAKATDSAGNSDAYAKEVKIVDGTATVTDSFAPAFSNVNNANGTVGSEYVFGSFAIDYKTAENRDYVGFELYVQRVQDANGVDVDESPLSDVSFETYRNPATDANKYVHVDNIRFTPTKTGKYMVVARGFHVSGASSVQISYVDVTGSATGSKPVSAVIGANLNFGQTYTLPNDYTVPETWGNSGVLRSITGGRFTMMGTEFTALQSTTYKFNDYVFEYSAGAASNLVNYDDSFGIVGNNIAVGQQVSSASDKASATFRVIGDAMPTYAELGAIVKLPNVTASSTNGSASKITCKVTDPDGQDVTVYSKDSKVFPEDYTGSAPVGHEFLFEAEYDGEYIVTYTAILNNKSTTASYTIKVGDVVAPDFTVDKGYVNGTLVGSAATVEASVNDKFDFAAIKLQGDDASATGLTYSKTITNPEGEVLATVTKRDSKNDGASYELTTAGRYVIEYKVTDEAGNSSKLTYSINVTSTSGSISSDSITTLVVVIIVVCVLAVAVAIIFFVRFRKRRA